MINQVPFVNYNTNKNNNLTERNLMMKYMDKITEIYVEVDDFCKHFEKSIKSNLLSSGNNQRNRTFKMSTSEVICIMVLFHLEQPRNLKNFYLYTVKNQLNREFPDLVSYNRFIELTKKALLPMTMFLKSMTIGKCTGISFIDSTPIRVCHHRRIGIHKTFKNIAERGHCSLGFFYGFKIHLIINDRGEILNFCMTKANVDDRAPLKSGQMLEEIWGKLFGDKGYISKKLFQYLFMDGIHLITKIKKNMKNIPMDIKDKVLLRKRSLIETVNDSLKNICQIEHTRHRSLHNFMVNIISGLIAYMLLPKKPSLNIQFENSNQMAIC